MKRALGVVLLVLGAGGAGAQVVYKSTMPDGKIVYGEKPASGAKKVDKLEPPPAQTGMTALTAEEKARAAKQVQQRPAAQPSPPRDAEDARRQLQKAEAAREAGKEPLPGERLGTAGGASRLTDAYYTRQKALEDAVTAARKRVEETRR
ncbi:MAG: hypothetical protein ACXW2I_00575 [Burkholderiales bacterium]